ncbi:hypothetical protein P4O66_021458, partial [Electrophorus voltai]
YQAALQLGQDPSNNCPDSQRTIRTVAQKQGSNTATLGPEYKNRIISIQNQADLVIGEVMWWDNGVYVCSVDAPGDTTGYPNAEVKLIVYSEQFFKYKCGSLTGGDSFGFVLSEVGLVPTDWLTVLFMIIGALLLIILFAVCCCQCCPQRCCCYVRCPCCPKTCCCPEKVVMQYRMMKEAQKAMSSWTGGQPIYAPLSSHSSAYPMEPVMYAGSAGKIPMSPVPPLPLPPPQGGLVHVAMPPPSIHGMPPSIHGNGSSHGTNQMLDYLENQMRGLDVNSPLIQSQPPVQHMPPPPQHIPQNVPFSAGPPSMLSGLDDGPASRRPPPSSRGGRPPTHSSSSSSYGHPRRDNRRYPPPSRHNMRRSYSQEDMLDTRSRASAPGYRPRSHSRDDLFRDTRDVPSRREHEYWASASDDDSSSRRGGRRGARGGAWTDHPPSYTEYEPGLKPTKRPDRFSDKSSRSGNSIVI